MKRTILNLGAILAAFLIGLAINNACADSLDNMSDNELRKLVAQLQQEINALKSRVAELEGKVGNGSGNSESNGMFKVDGVWFLPTGSACSRIKSSKGTTTTTYLSTGETTTSNSFSESNTTVDSFGRLLRIDYNLPDNYEYYYTEYSYNGKVVNSTTAYKTTVFKAETVTETEYY